MKLREEHHKEVVIGDVEEMEFAIDSNNSVIFEILRNKMYSDKIGSICREVASNSRDANREAGVGDLPIQIIISEENLLIGGGTSISFKDYGIGINPERMADVFIKYGNSTKQDSDAQTGGFGLGAKTPFAYTDSFIIKTVCSTESGNVMYVYNAIIDESGKGKMLKISEGLTERFTGTEIIVPIRTNQDKNKFETNAVWYTRNWEKVEYRGFTNLMDTSSDVIYDGGYFSIVGHKTGLKHKYSSVMGLLDGIPYPLSNPNIGLQILNNIDLSIQYNLTYDDVEVSSSREQIQVLDKTKEKLQELEKLAKEELTEKAIEFFSSAQTLKDYIERVSKGSEIGEKRLYQAILSNTKLYSPTSVSPYFNATKKIVPSFNDITLGEKGLSLQGHSIVRIDLKDYTQNDNGELTNIKISRKKVNRLPLDCLIDNLVLQDELRGSKKKYAKIVLSISKNDYFYLIEPMTKGSVHSDKRDLVGRYIQQDEETLEQLGISPLLMSEVNIQKARSKRKKSTKIKVKRNSNDMYGESSEIQLIKKKKIIIESVKLSKRNKYYSINDVYFIPIKRLGSATYDSNTEFYKNFVTSLFPSAQIFYINQTVYNRRLKPLGFKTIMDVSLSMGVQKRLGYLLEVKRAKVSLEKIGNFKFITKFFPKTRLKNFSKVLVKSQFLPIFDGQYKKAVELLYSYPSRLKDLGITVSKFDYDNCVQKYQDRIKKKFPLVIPYLYYYKIVETPLSSREKSFEEAKKDLKKYLK